MASGQPSYNCNQRMEYAEGVCIAGGGSFNCNSRTTLGEAVCIAGGNSISQCWGIGHEDFGRGVCLALGGSSSRCAGVSVSSAICSYTGNCRGYDAASIAISMVETCGIEVLHYGME